MALANNFGVLLPTRGVLVYAGSNGPRVEQTWQMAETAERAGYDSVWVGDSITSKPRMEPLTAMAAVAARTTAGSRSAPPSCSTPCDILSTSPTPRPPSTTSPAGAPFWDSERAAATTRCSSRNTPQSAFR